MAQSEGESTNHQPTTKALQEPMTAAGALLLEEVRIKGKTHTLSDGSIPLHHTPPRMKIR